MIEHVQNENEVILAKAGKPVAKLVPYRGAPRKQPGSIAGEIWIAPDFDEFPEEMPESFGLRKSRP